MPKTIIFTDLDGTLLDYDEYSFSGAEPALERVHQTDTPLIFCSAKTRSEQEPYREKLRIRDPFIVEDGGAIFIRTDYFPFAIEHETEVSEYWVIELGVPYWRIRSALFNIAMDLGFTIKSFGNMTADEVARVTGLNEDSASRAKAREYEETLTSDFTEEQLEQLTEALTKYGLRLTNGARFRGVTGGNDKGVATRRLSELYRQQYGSILTVGIGDSFNDIPMLSAVDYPMLVQKPDGRWEDIDMPRLRRIDGIGPLGWNKAIGELLSGKEKVLAPRARHHQR